MTNDNKKGRTSGCLKFVVIGFVIFLIFGFIATWISNKEWKKDRHEVLAAIAQAVETGDYETAISLGESHKSRDDSAINDLISKAEDLKRQAQEKAKQERMLVKQARIADLVAKIKDSQGDDRGRMLHELLSLDPRTAEFPDEIAMIREREKKLKEAADAEIAAKNAAAAETAAKNAADLAQRKIDEEIKRNAPTDLSWTEIDAVYSLQSKTTDIIKDEKWKAYKGKRVRWTGTVSEVQKDIFGKYQILVKMRKSSFVADVVLYAKEDQVDAMFKLSKGDSIIFDATLVEWGSLMPITANEGVIANRAHKE